MNKIKVPINHQSDLCGTLTLLHYSCFNESNYIIFEDILFQLYSSRCADIIALNYKLLSYKHCWKIFKGGVWKHSWPEQINCICYLEIVFGSSCLCATYNRIIHPFFPYVNLWPNVLPQMLSPSGIYFQSLIESIFLL